MTHSIRRNLFSIVVAALALCAPALPAQAQGESSQPQQQPMSKGELDALMAPIALYPDPLLSKILIAATFPDQVQDAAAWMKANPKLKDAALVNAAAKKNWDSSVKELVPVPGVIAMMDDQRDWMYALGGAFLSQQADVMASVQRLRRQAENKGSLKATSQQRVVRDGDTIAIQSADPQTMYVPYYNPTDVYGTWAYPDYQPYYWPQPYGYGYSPGAALATGLIWGAGVAISAAIWSNAFNWHTHNVWYGGHWYGNGHWNRGHYAGWHYRNYHNNNWHNGNWHAGYHGRYAGHYNGRHTYHGHTNVTVNKNVHRNVTVHNRTTVHNNVHRHASVHAHNYSHHTNTAAHRTSHAGSFHHAGVSHGGAFNRGVSPHAAHSGHPGGGHHGGGGHGHHH